MKIAMLDVDKTKFPNLPLMKLSAYHKSIGDSVEFYDPLFSQNINIAYLSKIFTFTSDYLFPVHADCIIKSGTGYFYPDGGDSLPTEIEHTFPDYDLYGIKNTAYGFLTRGCPRACDFCIVASKEGRESKKVADLSEFWNGQKNIVLLDPNFFACKEWEELSEQLIKSGANIDFTQGCDARIMSDRMIESLKMMKIKQVHFAWDKTEDAEFIIPAFEKIKRILQWDRRKLPVYVLTNFSSTIKDDLFRIEMLRKMGFWPYVMIYNKQSLPKGHALRRLQRWVNNRVIFESCDKFEDYLKHSSSTKHIGGLFNED